MLPCQLQCWYPLFFPTSLDCYMNRSFVVAVDVLLSFVRTMILHIAKTESNNGVQFSVYCKRTYISGFLILAILAAMRIALIFVYEKIKLINENKTTCSRPQIYVFYTTQDKTESQLISGTKRGNKMTIHPPPTKLPLYCGIH